MQSNDGETEHLLEREELAGLRLMIDSRATTSSQSDYAHLNLDSVLTSPQALLGNEGICS